jgi:hypothetical protein
LLAQRALNFEKVHHRAALVFSAGHLPPFPRETNPLLGTISSFCSQNTPFKPNYEICGLAVMCGFALHFLYGDLPRLLWGSTR